MGESPSSADGRDCTVAGPKPPVRPLTTLEWIALVGGFAACLAAFAIVTELVVHRWLSLTRGRVDGPALLFFGGWWVLAAARRLRPGALTAAPGSEWHPALVAYASSLPRVAALAFFIILVTSPLTG